MLYFLLAIIVFIAQLFPEPQAKTHGRQERGLGRRSWGAGKTRHGNAKVGSQSSTPKPTSYKAATAQAPSGSHNCFESARALGYKDARIGRSGVDVSTQTQVYAVSSGNVTDISEPKENVRLVMVDISTQTGHPAASESQRCGTSSSETSSHVRGAGLVNKYSSDTLASEGSPGKCQSEVEEKTSEVGFAGSSPSSNLASEATLVHNLVRSSSPSMMQQGPSEEVHALLDALADGEQDIYRSEHRLYSKQNSGHSPPFEKIENAFQDVGETISTVEPSETVLEQLLGTEKAAHQQTREELARLEDWCKQLEAENTELQTRAADESMGYQTEVSNAKGQIRNLVNSNEMYISTIEGLRRQEVSLNGDIAWYLQLGVDFYGRLQQAEQFLNPHDEVFAYYQHLISDAAQYFSIPTEAGDGDEEVHDYAVRVEEIDDTDHSEGVEDDQESGGFPILDTNNITSDHVPTNEADAGEAEARVAAIDEDEAPRANRPMRPGTANRVPYSVFAVSNGDASNGPSSSNLESASRAPPSTTSASSAIFSFSAKPQQNSEAAAAPQPAPNTKASETSARNRTGKGGIYSSREGGRHGTNRPRVSVLGGEDEGAFPSKADRNRYDGVGSPPVATAFPINFGFSETSAKTDSKREARLRPVFGH